MVAPSLSALGGGFVPKVGVDRREQAVTNAINKIKPWSLSSFIDSSPLAEYTGMMEFYCQIVPDQGLHA